MKCAVKELCEALVSLGVILQTEDVCATSLLSYERRGHMALIHAYLRFNGNAKEAFAFYQRCLDGELTITTVGQSPMAHFMPEKKDHVFHTQLQ